MHLDGEPLLLKIVRALHSTRRLAGRLNGRQEQSDQNPDDRDDDQKFHESKTRPGLMVLQSIAIAPSPKRKSTFGHVYQPFGQTQTRITRIFT
jgi:hypothetical protein